MKKAHFHLPGLFEFHEFYKIFLPLYFGHREYFYDWCDIASIYGAPEKCLWGGGREGEGNVSPEEVLSLSDRYGISSRLTFSNSLLRKEHLSDGKCNELCRVFEYYGKVSNGVIVYSELLVEYLKKNFPDLYLVSSTTKVLTDFSDLRKEVERKDFAFVVPDFRLNKKFDRLNEFDSEQKKRIEFLCNECCYEGCTERKACYENVSRICLGENCEAHSCSAPDGDKGYVFSKAMESPLFIGIDEIQKLYLPEGFENFKIEGRGLGSAMILEFLLYYMTKPEKQIKVREALYLDSMLDLF